MKLHLGLLQIYIANSTAITKNVFFKKKKKYKGYAKKAKKI